MQYILTILILAVTTILAPASQPTAQPAPAPATFTLPSVLTVQCEEDQPCWDCQTMGNRICGAPAQPSDAATTLDSFDYHRDVPTTVEYSRTTTPDVAPLAPNEFALESTTQPNVWHVYTETPTVQPAASQPVQPTASRPTASQPVAQPTASQPAEIITQPAPVTVPAQSSQSTANTVPAHKEDVPLGGAWAGMTLHYAQPAQPHKGYTTPVTDSNPIPAPHAEPNPTAPRICVNTLTLTDPKPANEC